VPHPASLSWGVIAFIFADLLILPILNIYRKYYGAKMALILLGTFYVAMVCAGYLVELLFGALGLIPHQRNAMDMHSGVSWNYTTWLNIAFLVVAAALLARFLTSGGLRMLKMMGGDPDASLDHHGEHDHPAHHDDHHDVGDLDVRNSSHGEHPRGHDQGRA
jgi:uncharacterized protein